MFKETYRFFIESLRAAIPTSVICILFMCIDIPLSNTDKISNIPIYLLFFFIQTNENSFCQYTLNYITQIKYTTALKCCYFYLLHRVHTRGPLLHRDVFCIFIIVYMYIYVVYIVYICICIIYGTKLLFGIFFIKICEIYKYFRKCSKTMKIGL